MLLMSSPDWWGWSSNDETKFQIMVETKYTNYVYYQGQHETNYVQWKRDVTNYSRLRAHIKECNYMYDSLILHNSLVTTNGTWWEQSTNTNKIDHSLYFSGSTPAIVTVPTIANLDISMYTGTKYVGLGIYYKESNGPLHADINALWLE